MSQPSTPNMFTPKQVALALGVSESSVKRWCDSGRLRAGRTAGGHRKLPLSSVVELVRETGQEIANPAVLGMVAVSARRKPAKARDEFLRVLLEGNEPAARELLLGFYQQGFSITEIGDDLIGPVFHQVGDGWEQGEISVNEERRCCEVTMAVLHELRRWLPDSLGEAPLAMTATPEQDFAEVPIRLVEIVLHAKGWRTLMAGSGLPPEEIRDAVYKRRPQLLCVSATHLADADAYVERHNQLLGPAALGVPVVVGGGAFCDDHRVALNCDRFAGSLAELEEWLDALADADAPTAATSNS